MEVDSGVSSSDSSESSSVSSSEQSDIVPSMNPNDLLDINLQNLNRGIEMERKSSSMRRRHNSMVVRGGKESQKWL